VLLVWCYLLTGYEPELVCDNLCKIVPRPPLPVVQVHGERVSSKGYEFELLSVRTLYTCELVAGRSRVRESVRYITHDSCAISVVPPFNINNNSLSELFFLNFINDEKEYKIKDILSKKWRREQLQYEVKWIEYLTEYNEWLWVKNIRSVEVL